MITITRRAGGGVRSGQGGGAPGAFGILVLVLVLVLVGALALPACDRPSSQGGSGAAGGDGPARERAELGKPGESGRAPVRVETPPRMFWAVVGAAPGHVVVISTRHAGIAGGLSIGLGGAVSAGDIVAEVDSPEVGEAIHRLRALEVQFHMVRGEQARLEGRIELLKRGVESAGLEADIAEEAMIALRLEGAPANGRELREVRIQAIVLRQQSRMRLDELEAARRELAAVKDRADALVRAGEALRSAIGPHIEPVGSQGRWAASVERPSIIRLATPRAGVVIDRFVEEGAGVQAGSSLLRIADLSVVVVTGEFELTLGPEVLRQLHGRGAAVRLTPGSEVVARGVLSVRVGPGEEGQGAAQVRMELPGAPALKYGARVEVEVLDSAPDSPADRPRDRSPDRTPQAPAAE